MTDAERIAGTLSEADSKGIIADNYYLASCDTCGWVGSSEQCGTDYWGDDSDVFCPKCHKSGADCGSIAEKHGAAVRTLLTEGEGK